MIVTEYMNLGALDDFLRVSAWSPGWESTNVLFFLSPPFSLGAWDLALLPLGRLTCCSWYPESQRDLVASWVI